MFYIVRISISFEKDKNLLESHFNVSLELKNIS